jgi:hypothetical protein
MAGTSLDKPSHDGVEKWFHMTGIRSDSKVRH